MLVPRLDQGDQHLANAPGQIRFRGKGWRSSRGAEEVEVIEHRRKPETLRVFSKLVPFWQEQPRQLHAFLDYSKRR